MANNIGHGGVRKGAGRKSKADEQALIERLTPLEEIAFKALKKGLQEKESWAVKLFFEYKFGKPAQKREVTLSNQTPVQTVINLGGGINPEEY